MGGINTKMNEGLLSGGILIVDDIPANLRLLKDLLVNQGFRVRPAASGELALKSAFCTPPELILLDVRMPNMDGYEVCRRLKAASATRDIPVIFISAMGDLQDRLLGFGLGAVDYITKPFEPGRGAVAGAHSPGIAPNARLTGGDGSRADPSPFRYGTGAEDLERCQSVRNPGH